MNIGICDADLIARKKHRFPNLASMKISGYHKARGDTVSLLTSFDCFENYDKVYYSKVFTDSNVPNEQEILRMEHVAGGVQVYFSTKHPIFQTK